MASTNGTSVGEGYTSDGASRGATMIAFQPMRANPTVTLSAVTTLKFQRGTSTSSDCSVFHAGSANNHQGQNYNNQFNGNFRVHIDGQTDSNFSGDGDYTRGVAIGDFFCKCDSEL
tara:strand:- start:152 stop:499 length:348 start_codon:yes stop_codon:yes gene_type:complete